MSDAQGAKYRLPRHVNGRPVVSLGSFSRNVGVSNKQARKWIYEGIIEGGFLETTEGLRPYVYTDQDFHFLKPALKHLRAKKEEVEWLRKIIG